MSLMKFDPASGTEKPYPSHAEQYRKHHGQVAWIFNPFTGKQRDARDIGSDTFGLLLQESPQAVVATPLLEWSKTLCDGKSVDYAAAEKACADLGEGWRLPTRRELESIQDLTRHDPCIDTEKFPDTKSAAYWSSTPCAFNTSASWFVYFSYGLSDSLHRDLNACVRAVRSVPVSQ